MANNTEITNMDLYYTTNEDVPSDYNDSTPTMDIVPDDVDLCVQDESTKSIGPFGDVITENLTFQITQNGAAVLNPKFKWYVGLISDDVDNGTSFITVDGPKSDRIVTSFVDPSTGIRVINDDNHTTDIHFTKLYRDALVKGLDVVIDRVRHAFTSFAAINKLENSDICLRNILQKVNTDFFNHFIGNNVWYEYVRDIELKRLSFISKGSIDEFKLNQKLIFSDSSNPVDKALSTQILPYKNPINRKPLTKDEFNKIDEFFSVFFEDMDKVIMKNFIGAIVTNTTQKELGRILVLQGNPSTGKSEFTSKVIKALCGEAYSFYPVFDSIFDKSNRFSTSEIFNNRVAVYDEAEFNAGGFGGHDFTGLDIEGLKSFIISGNLRVEQKYQKAFASSTISELQLICSNHEPIIQPGDSLDRRFVIAHIKPSTMFEKASTLDLLYDDFDLFVNANVELIAKYCADEFLQNTNFFDTLGNVSDRREAVSQHNVLNVLREDANTNDFDISDLFEHLRNALGGRQTQIAVVRNGSLYIVTGKNYVKQLSVDSQKFIKHLQDIYSAQVIKLNGATVRCVNIPL